MMLPDHGSVVAFAKSFGLFYLLGFFLVVLVYACWPSNREKFRRAANSIIDDKDKPCR